MPIELLMQFPVLLKGLKHIVEPYINPDVANVGIYTSECIGVEYVFKVSKVSKFLREELPV